MRLGQLTDSFHSLKSDVTDAEIQACAKARAREANMPYAGALLPAEAWQLMQRAGAKLVDVRTRPELEFVGRVPGSIEIEWNSWPDSVRNPGFLQQLADEVSADAITLFICRSGARSHHAAAAAAAAGYAQSYNVLQGFEGDKDPAGHRNSVGGWRVAGLPWIQG
jgi:rhodanese-related sulfurtransferase